MSIPYPMAIELLEASEADNSDLQERLHNIRYEVDELGAKVDELLAALRKDIESLTEVKQIVGKIEESLK